MEPIAPQVYSVSEFNKAVNDMLNQFEVLVKGEVTDFKISHNKWVTFDLKDDASRISCFMTTYQLTTQIQDGMEILVKGKAGIYVPYGRYSFRPTFIQPVGEGALQKAFELTKLKLETEGLFDEQYKKPLPRFPNTIGLITSEQAAAYTDFIRILNNRWGGVTVKLFPVHVQGESAPGEIVEAIEYFNKIHPVDVLVLTRGGGSLEDLQAFNTETVCRSVFSSAIPIVCGIGHERDTTLAELVADRRASTPSNAAEMVVPDKEEIMAVLCNYTDKMELSVQNQFTEMNNIFSRTARFFDFYIQETLMRFDRVVQDLSLQFGKITVRIETANGQINFLETQMHRLFDATFQKKYEQVERIGQLLQSLNPKSILKRGYSLTYRKGKIIRSVHDVTAGDILQTQLSDGTIESLVHGGATATRKKNSKKPSPPQQSLL